MGFVVAVGAVVVVLLLVAAVHDWRARRTGNELRATRAYWDGVQQARRDARHERAAEFLSRPRWPRRRRVDP